LRFASRSHDYDRSKLRAYASAGVKECWMVLGPEKQIEVYLQPKNGEFLKRTFYGPGGSLTSLSVSRLSVSLENLFSK
jgi:Uma2 family endonuclease